MDQYSTIQATDAQATQWSVPEITATCNRLAVDSTKNGVVLLLDDIHEANIAVQAYLLEMLLERKLGQYKFADNVAIVATMNASDEARFDGFSSAVRNRLAIHEMPFNFDAWFTSHGAHYHHYISSFLRTHSQYIQEEESVDTEGFGTPRAYDFLQNTVASLPLPTVSKHINEIALQYISKNASNALTRHVQYLEAIDFQAIVNSRELKQINSEKPLDQILYAYIINYITTFDDFIYMVDLLNKNSSGADNWIGMVIGEIKNKYLAHYRDSKEVPLGQILVANKLLQKPHEPFMNLTASQKKLYNETTLTGANKFLQLAQEYTS